MASASRAGASDVVLVPGGRLLMGSTAAQMDACVHEWTDRLIDPTYAADFADWIAKECPQHPVDVDAFTAWRYPVTNADAQAWVDATGHAAPASLADGPPDHPVWGLGLAGAEALAGWLGERDGVPWRLPTEAEWEWMAKGPEGRAYPFGERFDAARCNTVEQGVGGTTPVDAHPAGESWCGVLDLAGNVEEWTSSRYQPYPGGRFVTDDLVRLVGPDYPIVRGGSFALGGDLARSARRHGPHPGPRFRYVGLRLVGPAQP